MAFLNKISNIGDSTISSLIQDNMIEHFDWGFMDAGGFVNVEIPTSGLYGGDKHKLRLVDDPRYTDGQVWEGFRSNWIWQSGFSGATQPLTTTHQKYPGVSGVFVDGAFYPTSGVGTYSHHIDYPNGRVVFDSAIPTTSEVTAEFSYKWVKFTRASSSFFREIQYRSQRADGDFTLSGSGDWSQLGETRLQLPAVGVEVVKDRDFQPYALGGLSHYVKTDVLFHVLAENDYDRDKILDIISFQEEVGIEMFDSDRIGRNEAFPLDYRGMVNNNAKIHTELIKPSGEGGYKYDGVGGGQMIIRDSRVSVSDEISPNLYHGVVRLNAEVIK
tara:strand:- start:1278 stop:2264 length:987 start_codon:yes stop_codon:yes gene_type:complete